ncbi:pentatricopeptide repeat-containing protein At2g27610-like [Aristolochia californica]|uniref:pentatricopeptide repeat-containing protein At2g27610-like n=1 Tax=Aristolochia californica TaxID=171875 RepID=UPI0035D9FB55
MSILAPAPSLAFTSKPSVRISRTNISEYDLSPLLTKKRSPSFLSTTCAHGKPSLSNDWPHLLQISIRSEGLLLGMAIHAFLLKSGSHTDIFPGNNLVNLYSKFSELDNARQVLEEMPIKNTITWTTLLNGYSQIDDLESVFGLARQMHRSGESFNGHTCTAILQACGTRKDRNMGEQIHCLVIKSGVETDLIVGTSLLSMYSKCGAMDEAEIIFNGLVYVDVRCFSSMISGYAKSEDGEKAVKVFCSLLDSGLEPSEYTLTNVLSSCDESAYLAAGMQIHGLAVKYGRLYDLSVGNAVITMYGRNGLVEEAERMFCWMGEKNLVSWTAILSVYMKSRHFKKAIDGFKMMLKLRIDLDSSCLAALINGCSKSKNLELVLQIHGPVIKQGYLSDVYVATALVDAYSKCGDMKSARRIFDGLQVQNIVCFNALLGGYVEADGEKENPFILFNRIRLNGTKPDTATFALLFSLSAEEASLAKGKCLHAYMIKVGLENHTTVGNALITMYAKCGSIENSYSRFSDMVDRDTVTWNAMISAYALHGRGKEALAFCEKMEGEGFAVDAITLVVTLQACCYSGLYEDGFRLYNTMERRYGIKPGLEHHACMIDLLGRAGYVSKAIEFVKESPFVASPLLWRTLVNVCKLNGDSHFGSLASRHLLQFAPDDAASHVLVSNFYASIGKLDESAKVRMRMNEGQMRKEIGYSWIELNGKVHRFGASDENHPESRQIYRKLDEVNQQLRENGHLFDL